LRKICPSTCGRHFQLVAGHLFGGFIGGVWGFFDGIDRRHLLPEAIGKMTGSVVTQELPVRSDSSGIFIRR
jgi:hypothetical protein